MIRNDACILQPVSPHFEKLQSSIRARIGALINSPATWFSLAPTPVFVLTGWVWVWDWVRSSIHQHKHTQPFHHYTTATPPVCCKSLCNMQYLTIQPGGTHRFSPRLSNKKMTTANSAVAIQCEWIKIIHVLVRWAKMYFLVCCRSLEFVYVRHEVKNPCYRTIMVL